MQEQIAKMRRRYEVADIIQAALANLEVEDFTCGICAGGVNVIVKGSSWPDLMPVAESVKLPDFKVEVHQEMGIIFWGDGK